MTNSAEVPWKSCEASHEGFPLMLRCPQEIPFDRQSDFPRMVALTHKLDEVSDSGLPTTSCNGGLTGFDDAAIDAFQTADRGVTVLVETFGGNRTYYSYVGLNTDVEATVAALRESFPDLRLEHTVHENADWRFIRRYAADYSM